MFARRKPAGSIICWSTNIKTPTRANIASSRRWPAEHRNLCVVGDDDQSIYGWRGAEVEHILHFHHDWPGAKIIRLEDNYRTCEAILEFANRLIAFNRQRHEKVLRASRPAGLRPIILQCKDEIEEAVKVVSDIKQRLENPGIQPRDIAILCRTNEQPRPFEIELRREKLPYVLIGGQSFYDRREVKDMLAYLRVLDNPRDEPSLLRIINTPPRGIGQATVTTLLGQAVEQGRPLWDLLGEVRSRRQNHTGRGRVGHQVSNVDRELCQSDRH